jgi:hypothetical protein
MNPEIVNIYIERLINEVQELVKSKLLIDTQLKYSEMMNNALSEKIKELETQLEKLNKKKTKETLSSDTF